MQRIYLVRHGIAGDPDAWRGPDDSRPLNGEGRRRFRETARAFAKLGERIEALCTSPLVRAVQTAEILAAALEVDETIVLEELRPNVPVQQLLDRAGQLSQKRIALVGHDPQLSGAAGALGSVEPARIEFPKGAIVRFDVDDAAARKAVARWWLAPGEKKPHEGLPVK
ncbi:MAG TPA: histidine phosphatase family protein [Myxococcales bacterium]|nr:histidine phosphatase family protein [Myxococcales bacterium]